MKTNWVSVQSLMVVVLFAGLALVAMSVSPGFAMILLTVLVSGVLGRSYFSAQGRSPQLGVGGSVIRSVVGALLLVGGTTAIGLFSFLLDPTPRNHMNIFNTPGAVLRFGFLFALVAVPVAAFVGLLAGAGRRFAQRRPGPGVSSQKPPDPIPERRS